MPNVDALAAAADDYLAAALLGEGFEAALASLAAAAGGRDATLLLSRGSQIPAIIATRDIDEPVADFMAGRAPPSSRQVRASRPLQAGFFTDLDDYTEDELRVDPFYQEFLRPIEYFWHANTRLLGDDTESVELSIKRWAKLDPYTPAEVALLDSILPKLRAATRVARDALNAQAAGMVGLLQYRGSPVFELDSWGRVRRAHGVSGPPNDPVLVVRRRLAAVDKMVQPDLDAAVAAAVTPPRRPSVAVLRDVLRAPYYLQFFPIPGRARDIFLASTAVGVLIRPRPRLLAPSFERVILREAFGLTDREAELASLIRQGVDLAEAAGQMGVLLGTARNHLKSVFDKTGTRRQGELVSLLARFQP